MTGNLPSRRRAIGRRMRETVALMTDTLIPPIDETKAEIDRLDLRTQLFIDGAFRDAHGGQRFVTENPATGRPITEVAQGGPADVDIAVAAARRAADMAAGPPQPADRKRILVGWADLIEANGRELGSSRPSTRASRSPTRRARHPRDRGLHPLVRGGDRQALRQVAPTPEGTVATITREPIGVVGAVIPWNYPAPMAAWKLGPALATGNTVVIKPARHLAEPAPDRRAGRRGRHPQRRAQRGHGPGDTVGEALGRHPDVDCLAFTGSTEVGRRFLHYSAESNLKRVLLESAARAPRSYSPTPPTSTRLPPTSRSRSSGTWARTARPGRG